MLVALSGRIRGSSLLFLDFLNFFYNNCCITFIIKIEKVRRGGLTFIIQIEKVRRRGLRVAEMLNFTVY